jgi:hypothetical protein
LFTFWRLQRCEVLDGAAHFGRTEECTTHRDSGAEMAARGEHVEALWLADGSSEDLSEEAAVPFEHGWTPLSFLFHMRSRNDTVALPHNKRVLHVFLPRLI